MSHRAINRLRRPEDLLLRNAVNEDDNDDSDEDDDDDDNDAGVGQNTVARFAMMNDDEDSDDDESRSISDDSDDDGDGDDNNKGQQNLPQSKAGQKKPSKNDQQDQEKEEDDLDDILAEYKTEEDDDFKGDDTDEARLTKSVFAVVTNGVDPRDLDIDYAAKAVLLQDTTTAEDDERRSNNNSSSSSRRGGGNRRQAPLFGPPRDGWPRPPHYVGGGMGMTSYADIADIERPSLPWPYSDMKVGDDRCPSYDKWFQFTFSDSYRRDLQDFTAVKNTGDPNSLCMFVAHHPFVVDALLQLSVVLYQTNQQRDGLSLLKRALWVFENASFNSFLKVEGRRNSAAFMDHELPENANFFQALFRLMRVSHVAGLLRTSLAVSRFLLALDPLRDPMNTLLAMDYFALVPVTDSGNAFVVKFVESNVVYVCYRDDDHPDGFQCSLLGCPNWAYSYGLALFRLNDRQKEADDALQAAVLKFPTVVGLLLAKFEVNTSARSFQTDWPSVLPFLDQLVATFQKRLLASTGPVTQSFTIQSLETAIRIFVQMNFKLWKDPDVLKWLYRNLDILKENGDDQQESASRSISPALMRFAKCNPSDFEDKFTTMPADANPLVPDMVQHALNIDPNRPRLMQRIPRGGGFGGGMELDQAFAGANFFGPPHENVDLDEPLLQVFLQTLQPWARVEGVAPPPPPP